MQVPVGMVVRSTECADWSGASARFHVGCRCYQDGKIGLSGQMSSSVLGKPVHRLASFERSIRM